MAINKSDLEQFIMMYHGYINSDAPGWRGEGTAIKWFKRIWNEEFAELEFDVVDNFISYCVYPTLYDAEYIDWEMEFDGETDITEILDDFIFILVELSKEIKHTNPIITR